MKFEIFEKLRGKNIMNRLLGPKKEVPMPRPYFKKSVKEMAHTRPYALTNVYLCREHP